MDNPEAAEKRQLAGSVLTHTREHVNKTTSSTANEIQSHRPGLKIGFGGAWRNLILRWCGRHWATEQNYARVRSSLEPPRSATNSLRIGIGRNSTSFVTRRSRDQEEGPRQSQRNEWTGLLNHGSSSSS